MDMTDQINIQASQIQSITKRGMRYLDESGVEHFINFDGCYQELIEIWNHPNLREFGMSPEFVDQYLELLENLKIKKVIGFLSPDGGIKSIIGYGSGKPVISVGNVKIQLDNKKDYITLREKFLIRDLHFIIRFFDVI